MVGTSQGKPLLSSLIPPLSSRFSLSVLYLSFSLSLCLSVCHVESDLVFEKKKKKKLIHLTHSSLGWFGKNKHVDFHNLSSKSANSDFPFTLCVLARHYTTGGTRPPFFPLGEYGPLRQDPPLDLSFWSFLTFLHHGIEKVERHLLRKFYKKIRRKSWSNVPPKLVACIGFLYKVVHKIGRLRKFNRSRGI